MPWKWNDMDPVFPDPHTPFDIDMGGQWWGLEGVFGSIPGFTWSAVPSTFPTKMAFDACQTPPLVRVPGLTLLGGPRSRFCSFAVNQTRSGLDPPHDATCHPLRCRVPNTSNRSRDPTTCDPSVWDPQSPTPMTTC